MYYIYSFDSKQFLEQKPIFFPTNSGVNVTCADHTLDFSAKSQNLGIEFQLPISDSPHTQELHGFLLVTLADNFDRHVPHTLQG